MEAGTPQQQALDAANSQALDALTQMTEGILKTLQQIDAATTERVAGIEY